MAVWALGINHNTAPLDLRGRFAFALDQIAPTLQGLRSALTSTTHHPQVETAILSTCNRTEIYCAANAPALDHTLGWLAQSGGVSPEVLRSHSYLLEDGGVARHAFRVASGLDSMVLGEAQILGQLKNAVRLASQLFEDLTQIRILFVGAGEMIELVSTHFAARHPKQMKIANRTAERGEKLAAQFGASTMPLGELPEHLHEYDAVISCTASTLPIIGLGAVERALKKRKHRPIFMVDLAVPRDIESEVKDLRDVYLYTVDDLASVVRTGQAQRQAAVEQAEVIIDHGVQSFLHWLEQRNPQGGAVPLIQQLNQQTDAWRAQEIARAKKLLAKGEDVDAVLEALSRGLTQKMLHGSMTALRQGSDAERAQAAATVQRLFLRGHTAQGSQR